MPGAGLFAALPLLDVATAPATAHAALLSGGNGLVAATDAGLLLFGLLLGWAGWRMMPSISPAARWRWQVGTRVLTAIFGGYALAALASATLATLCARFMPLPDAALTGMLLSFAWYAAAVIWTFASATLLGAWNGLLLASGGLLLLFLFPH